MIQDLNELTAISPLDGRYAKHTQRLRRIVSEYGLIRTRCLVELRWFQHLANNPAITELPALTEAQSQSIEKAISDFTEIDAQKVKAIETKSNHDVKAVEYLVKDKIAAIDGLTPFTEFVHFACTSEDINNLSHGLMLQATLESEIIPSMNNMIQALAELAKKYASAAMLSRTHGQAASPTTMGKELANSVARLRRQLDQIKGIKILGKINGAVGNYNAHQAAYKNVDWLQISESFVHSLGLTWNPYTTQIEPHDYVAELFDAIKRFNTILLDLDRDIWSYISIGYFKQKKLEGEIGSSTMPHKVNPIEFENSEGNLGLANALLEHMAAKLPISRWQRDLTDSTVLRNMGVGLAYCLIAYRSTLKGLTKLELNEPLLAAELNANWQVLAEPIQTIMRKHSIKGSYEILKEMTRGHSLNRNGIKQLIDGLDLPATVKREVLNMTPANYIGAAEELTYRILKE